MEDFFQVGIIVSTHGLRGEVRVYPTTDDARRFKRLKEVMLVPEKQGRIPKGAGKAEPAQKPMVSPGTPLEQAGTVLKIESVKFFKQFVLLKFEGLDRLEDVERYRRYSLMVPRSNAVHLERDEYFIADLIGLTVQDEDGTKIGVLKDVLETGANDVYIITLHSGKELLLPAIRQCVLEVDVEAGFIRVHLLDGLMECNS